MVHLQSYLSSKLSSREKNKYIFVTCFVILKNATYFLLIWIFFVVIKIDNFLQLDFSANIIPVYFLLLWYIMVYCLEWLIIDFLIDEKKGWIKQVFISNNFDFVFLSLIDAKICNFTSKIEWTHALFLHFLFQLWF